MYERLFEWLIKYINKTLANDNNEQSNSANRSNQSSLVIGVLDIYGFEIFENNRLISFVVNLTTKDHVVHLVSNNYVLIIAMKNCNNCLLN